MRHRIIRRLTATHPVTGRLGEFHAELRELGFDDRKLLIKRAQVAQDTASFRGVLPGPLLFMMMPMNRLSMIIVPSRMKLTK